MKKVYQDKFGKGGNCFSACLASILEIDLKGVPNFQEPNGEWYRNYKKWLMQKYELDLIAITNWNEAENWPKTYAIVSGTSLRGLAHSTVYFGIDLVHDPHPESSGVKDITDWIYFVPKEPHKFIKKESNA